MWHNSDVHAWSQKMSTVLKKEYPNLVGECERALPHSAALINHMLTLISNTPAKQALIKMKGRLNVRDKDLCNISPAGLLSICWETAQQASLTRKEIETIFNDVLSDMGNTCIQGDTHRLFSLYCALTRSILA